MDKQEREECSKSHKERTTKEKNKQENRKRKNEGAHVRPFFYAAELGGTKRGRGLVEV